MTKWMALKPTIQIIHTCGKLPNEPTQSWWRDCKCKRARKQDPRLMPELQDEPDNYEHPQCEKCGGGFDVLIEDEATAPFICADCLGGNC